MTMTVTCIYRESIYVVGRLADSLLPAGLTDLGSEFDFLQDADDMAFAEL